MAIKVVRLVTAVAFLLSWIYHHKFLSVTAIKIAAARKTMGHWKRFL